MRLPADSAASSTPPGAAEPRSAANAGTATCTIPTAVPKAASTPKTVRIPAAPSGPSQPTSWGSPRQRREPGVGVNASAPPAPSAAAASTATCGGLSADDRGHQRRRRDHRDLEHDRDHRVGGLALAGVLDERAPQRAHRGGHLRERRTAAQRASGEHPGRRPSSAAITSATSAGTCPGPRRAARGSARGGP